MPHSSCFSRRHGGLSRLAPLTGALCAAAMFASTADALVIDEGTMDPGEWNQTLVVQTGPASLLTTAPPAGGNPDSNWLHQFTVPNGTAVTTRIREANIYTAVAYDPAISGALASVTIAFDAQAAFTSFAEGTSGFLIPALAQGGRIYRQASAVLPVLSVNWSPRSFTSGLAADWIEQDSNAHPDFSAAGGAMQFGYMFSLGTNCPSTAGCRGVATGTALDNFHVEAIAASVPEPASWALLLAGGLFTAWRRRFCASASTEATA